MQRAVLRMILVFSLLFLTVSCEISETVEEPENQSRVLLFYLAVDEVTISADWYDKVQAICAGAQASDDILIYLDSERSTPRLDRVVVRNGIATTETLDEFAEENSASAGVLKRIIDRMQALYPRRSYGLVAFTHSSGWLPAGTLLNPTRSIGIDDHPDGERTDREEMELVDFASAIPAGLFDFIVFESCLTANVEVAYELREKTPYLLASAAEIVSPGFTPLYEAYLSTLTDLELSPEKALSTFAVAYYDLARSSETYAYSATVSVIRTAALEELATAVRGILDASSASVDPDRLQHFDRYALYNAPSYSRYFDLEEYVGILAGEGERFSAFREILDKTVPYQAATAAFLMSYQGFAITHHCGLTTYVERPEYDAINAAWRQTAWCRAIGGGE